MDVYALLYHASKRRLFCISILTRVAIAMWMWLSNRVIGGGESYDSCDSFFPSRYRSVSFLSHWDNVHFRHVATHGYSHEHVHAFFPGVPLLVLLLESIEWPAVTLHLLAMVAYGVAVVALREFTKVAFKQPSTGNNIDEIAPSCFSNPREIGAAVFLMLLSPANAFTVAGYSESFYACAAMLGFWLAALDQPLLQNCDTELIHSKAPGCLFAAAMVCFCCAALLRSNGFLLGALIMIPPLVVFLRRPLVHLRHRQMWLVHTCLRGLCTCVLLVPYLATNYIGWKTYCVAAGEPSSLKGQRCTMMGFYQMIQGLYWNVGWFRQWTLQNGPNFLIAAPPILFGVHALWCHWLRPREVLRLDRNVFEQLQVWHLLFLWYLAVTTIHVQVVNRIVFACPALYWIGARQLVRAPRSWWTRFQIAYCLICSIMGPLMFANNMNWT